ncbi:hypothetical protein EON81_24670 [bacterium]|nr:MAG: hypothetical protein EON81_24670 [bacterium]
MTYQQAILPLIEDAYKNLFGNADALAGKLDYKASETTRTPLELVVECVQSPKMFIEVFRAGRMPEDVNAEYEKSIEDAKRLTDVAACRAEYESYKADLFEAITSFPEARLAEDIETPWGTFPWRDLIAYLYWNPMWHAGQLSYIQTIHGDTEMHGQ